MLGPEVKFVKVLIEPVSEKPLKWVSDIGKCKDVNGANICVYVCTRVKERVHSGVTTLTSTGNSCIGIGCTPTIMKPI